MKTQKGSMLFHCSTKYFKIKHTHTSDFSSHAPAQQVSWGGYGKELPKCTGSLMLRLNRKKGKGSMAGSMLALNEEESLAIQLQQYATSQPSHLRGTVPQRRNQTNYSEAIVTIFPSQQHVLQGQAGNCIFTQA